MDILQVVSRVRRHLRRPTRRRPPQQQQQRQLAPQPPDLRRWSDFENPFPSVSPGGYRRYYETHARTPGPGPPPRVIASAPVSSSAGELAKRPRRHTGQDPLYGRSYSPAPVDDPLNFPNVGIPVSASPSTSTLQSSSPPHPLPSGSTRHKGKNRQGLGTVPEWDRHNKTSAVHMTQPARLHPTLSVSSTATRGRLRRRRGRLLRTPSVIRDFAGWGPGSTVMSALDSLDGEGLTSESSESHFTDTPPTTVEGHEFDEELSEQMKGMYSKTSHTERAESRNSFHSAKSDLGDYK